MPRMNIYFGLSLLLVLTTVATARQNYAMYVWTDGYDHTISGCDTASFLADDKSCFSHTWDTVEKRKWLWDTCNVAGREVSAIFLSDLHRNLQDAYDNTDCNTTTIRWVRETIAEGHQQVPNLKIYALYAVSDLPVSEKNLVKYVVYYNDNCAVTANERLDGVATNNEAYGPIKCGDMAARLQYLDDLQQIVTEAGKQVEGTLLTHYSVGWHWGRCDSTPSMMTWNGKTSDVSHHFIDIFDSVDVQVGYIRFPAISERMVLAGYDYAQSLSKDIYATVYTNEGPLCVSTFFPDTSPDVCDVTSHTEAEMMSQFDLFATNGIAQAKPCIHYFRGSYSSGGTAEWPLHSSAASDGNCSWRQNAPKSATPPATPPPRGKA